MTRTVRALPVDSLTSNWHFGSKSGQPRNEHAVPLIATGSRSAFARGGGDGGFACWPIAAGAVVTAKATIPATKVAAGQSNDRLEHCASVKRMNAWGGNAPTGWTFPMPQVKLGNRIEFIPSAPVIFARDMIDYLWNFKGGRMLIGNAEVNAAFITNRAFLKLSFCLRTPGSAEILQGAGTAGLLRSNRYSRQ